MTATTTAWDPTLHPRTRAGKFDTKVHTEPEGTLGADDELAGFMLEPEPAAPFTPWQPVVYTYPDGYVVRGSITRVDGDEAHIEVSDFDHTADPEKRVGAAGLDVHARHLMGDPNVPSTYVAQQRKVLDAVAARRKAYLALSERDAGFVHAAAGLTTVRDRLAGGDAHASAAGAAGREVEDRLESLSRRGIITESMATGLLESDYDDSADARKLEEHFSWDGRSAIDDDIAARAVQMYVDAGWAEPVSKEVPYATDLLNEAMLLKASDGAGSASATQAAEALAELNARQTECLDKHIVSLPDDERAAYYSAADRIGDVARVLGSSDLLPTAHAHWGLCTARCHDHVTRTIMQASLVREYGWLTGDRTRDVELVASVTDAAKEHVRGGQRAA